MKTNKEEIFLKIPQLLINASGYVNNSGCVVKLNLSDKLVYAYMKSRFDFFMSLGKEYYDTQQSVADYCNMDLKTCGVILRKFEDNGVISVIKKPQGNFLKNIYTYVGRMKLCGGRGAFEIKESGLSDTYKEDVGKGVDTVDVFDHGDAPDNYYRNMEEVVDEFDPPF